MRTRRAQSTTRVAASACQRTYTIRLRVLLWHFCIYGAADHLQPAFCDVRVFHSSRVVPGEVDDDIHAGGWIDEECLFDVRVVGDTDREGIWDDLTRYVIDIGGIRWRAGHAAVPIR